MIISLLIFSLVSKSIFPETYILISTSSLSSVRQNLMDMVMYMHFFIQAVFLKLGMFFSLAFFFDTCTS